MKNDFPVVKVVITLPPGASRNIPPGHIAIQSLTRAVAHIARCIQGLGGIQLDYVVQVEPPPAPVEN